MNQQMTQRMTQSTDLLATRRITISCVLISFVLVALSCILVTGILNLSGFDAAAGAATPPPSTTTYSPPASIAANCSSDVTAALKHWLRHVPRNSAVDFPSNGCYLVSNSPKHVLTLAKLSDITINGNGTTLKQTTYDCTPLKTDQPVMRVPEDTDLTIDDLVLDGAKQSQCKGAAPNTHEGLGGIAVGGDDQYKTGSANVTFNHVTVENVLGDALDIVPDLGHNWNSINTNITFENGTVTNIGYDVLVVEGGNGVHFIGNTVSHYGMFSDEEVDNVCGTPPKYSFCYLPNGTPRNEAQWNITIAHNTLTHGGKFLSSEQSPCIPQKNFVIEDNKLGTGANGAITLSGSESSSCSPDSGLIISGNVSTKHTKSPCGGADVHPPGCALIEVLNYHNVTITKNRLTAWDGGRSHDANHLYVPCIALDGVSRATVTGNTCNDAWDAVGRQGDQFHQLIHQASSGITACDNTYGLTEPVTPKGETKPRGSPADPMEPARRRVTGKSSSRVARRPRHCRSRRDGLTPALPPKPPEGLPRSIPRRVARELALLAAKRARWAIVDRFEDLRL